jgi:hypothetical protein
MTKLIVAFRNFAKASKNTQVHFDKNGINLQFWKQLVESYVRWPQRCRLDWTVRGSNHSGGEIFCTVQTDPGAHPASFTVSIGSLTVCTAAGAWR